MIAASTLASCGESVLDSAGDRDRRDKGRVGNAVPRADVAKGKFDKKSVTQQKEGRTEPGVTEANGGNEDADTSTTAVDEPKAEDPGPTGSRPSEPAESCAGDLARDMEGAGSMPSYADLRRGCVREDGDQIVLAATTVGSLPARMPDRNTNLAIGFELTPPSGESVYVGAEATADGWSAYVSEGGSSRTIGSPAVRGGLVVITVPAAGLGGGRLSWTVESSWLRSTLTTTEYAFDDAPNGSVASFDR